MDKAIAFQIYALVHFERQQNSITFNFQVSQNDPHILNRAKAKHCSKSCNDSQSTEWRGDKEEENSVLK